MPTPPRRIFLSYTSDLVRFPRQRSYVVTAESAIARFGDARRCMRDFTAATIPPAALCRDRLLECDVYVGLIGMRFGSEVEDGRSFVEFEFDEATLANLPRLIFMLDVESDRLGLPPILEDVQWDRQRLLRDRLLNSGVTVAVVGDTDELRAELQAALYELAPGGGPANTTVEASTSEADGSDRFDPDEYEGASETQRRQAERLLALAHIHDEDQIIDVGCGTGFLSFEIARRWDVRRVLGIDKKHEMVEGARATATRIGSQSVEFQRHNVLNYDPPNNFDLVVSNHTMHWITPPEEAYKRLFRVLRSGGRLAVHQGGDGTYRELLDVAMQVADDLGLSNRLEGWQYPHYYPSVYDYRRLLANVGFDDVQITSAVSDATKYPTLVHDFAAAGLLPFLEQLGQPAREKAFRARFFQQASQQHPRINVHNLYVTARRP